MSKKRKEVIIVPWDYSESSEIALMHAVQLGKEVNNHVMIARFLEKPGLFTGKAQKEQIIAEEKEKLKEVGERIVKDYGINPYVTVEIMNQRLFILGEVRQPGVVPVTNGTMNLIEAIARSGDLTDFAERRGILILRGDLRDPEVRMIDLTHMSTIKLSSLYLKPNDIVYVQPRASKGRKIAYDEISPPFQLVSSILQPFVNITYLAKAWNY